MKKDKVIIIRVKDNLKFKASVRAESLELSLSEYIRELINNDLNKKK